MANNQLAHYQSLVFGDLSEQDIVTIRETIGKDCNESQFKLFMAISKNSGANPILNEIYPTVRQGSLTIQFGVDFYVRKAKETDGYKGYDVQLVHENDEFKMHQEKDEDGRYFVVIDEHSWGFPRGKVTGGYAIAYKEGLKPFTVIMEVDEVDHFKRSQIGMQKTMWSNYFNDMFKKHMVRRALKAAFNLNFDDEESLENKGSDGIPEHQPKERKDITPNEDIIDAPPKQNAQPQDDEAAQLAAVNEEIKTKFKKLGLITKQAKAEYMEQHAPSMANNPTLADRIGFSNLLDMHIEMQDVNTDDADMLE